MNITYTYTLLWSKSFPAQGPWDSSKLRSSDKRDHSVCKSKKCWGCWGTRGGGKHTKETKPNPWDRWLPNITSKITQNRKSKIWRKTLRFFQLAGVPQGERKLKSEQSETVADEGFERNKGGKKQQQRPGGEARAVRLIWFLSSAMDPIFCWSTIQPSDDQPPVLKSLITFFSFPHSLGPCKGPPSAPA